MVWTSKGKLTMRNQDTRNLLLSCSGRTPVCPIKTEICVIFQKLGISRVIKLFGRASKMAKVEFK
ncbi:MAG TPA: hypothetical protein ENG35_01060 [Desulfobacteraceae bacterium]|nr:hypothetical protein [Desulfobacteraceae bacterium]